MLDSRLSIDYVSVTFVFGCLVLIFLMKNKIKSHNSETRILHDCISMYMLILQQSVMVKSGTVLNLIEQTSQPFSG